MKTLIAVGVIAIAGVLWWSAEADKARAEFANCIYQEARAANYPESIYGERAWHTFAPLCVK